MDLIITGLPVVTKDLPISPRFTPYDFLSRFKFSSEPLIFRNLYHIFLASVGTFSGSFFTFYFIFSVPYFGLACDHGFSFLCLEE